MLPWIRVNRMYATCFHAGILFYSEDRSDMFLRNIGWLSKDYTELYPRRYYCSYVKYINKLPIVSWYWWGYKVFARRFLVMNLGFRCPLVNTPQLNPNWITLLPIRVESFVTTDRPSASLSWNKAPVWGLRPDSYYCHTVAGLLMWGAFSDKWMGLSFTIAAGPRQCSH
jgi:hypothetical protein